MRSETECACGAFLPDVPPIDATPEGTAIGGLMWAILFWLVVGTALVVYGSVA